MFNSIQVFILGFIQGVSELFPISSLGHLVLIPNVLHWGINESGSIFLAFAVFLHLGTAIALLLFFYKDWVRIIKKLFSSFMSGKFSDDSEEHLGWLIIVGSIPVGIIGLLLEKQVGNIFKSPYVAALFLVINGIILYVADIYRKLEKNKKDMVKFSLKDVVFVGFAQSFALIPGISRSGISMAACLALGLNYEDSAKLSFMLATPLIFAAALLESRKLIMYPTLTPEFLFGGIVAGIAAYFSTKFLMKYFENGKLLPFAYYSVIIGIVFTILLKFF